MERKGQQGQIEDDVRALIFGPPEEDGADRAVHNSILDLSIEKEIAVGFDLQKPRHNKVPLSSTEKSNDDEFIPFIDDLSMETRYIVFPAEMLDSQVIFDHVANIAREIAPNHETFPHEKKVLGYVFHEVRFGFFCLQVFKHADGLGLSCELHDGFAPALTPFWNAVKDELAKCGLGPANMEGEEDSDEDFDDAFFDSDTEITDDGGLFLLDLSIPENKFLDLQSDPTLVEEWIEDIKDPNFSQDTLLVLAYNCQASNNLMFLMEKFVQSLFEAVVASLSLGMDLDLPGIRSACMFLDLVAQNAEVKVTEVQLRSMVNQLARWTISRREDSNRVNTSSEIANLLSQNLLKFYNMGAGSVGVPRKLLKTIRQESKSGTVKQNLDNFLTRIV